MRNPRTTNYINICYLYKKQSKLGGVSSKFVCTVPINRIFILFTDESNLLCLYDLLSVAPDILCKSQLHLLEPLTNSLKDVSEVMRSHVACIIGIFWAYGFSESEFNSQVSFCGLRI